MNSNALAMPAPIEKAVSKRPKEDTENRGELNRVEIEVTENGFVTRCSFDPEKINPKLDRYSQMPEDEKMSFETPETALAYVGKLLKGQSDYEEQEGKGDGKKKKPTEKEEKAENETE